MSIMLKKPMQVVHLITLVEQIHVEHANIYYRILEDEVDKFQLFTYLRASFCGYLPATNEEVFSINPPINSFTWIVLEYLNVFWLRNDSRGPSILHNCSCQWMTGLAFNARNPASVHFTSNH